MVTHVIRGRGRRVLQDMKRITPLILIALAAAALTACGSSPQPAQKSAAASPATTVALPKVSGVGQVLVDSKGFALYSPKQDTSGMIRCTGSCTAMGAADGQGLADRRPDRGGEARNRHAPRRPQAGHVRRQAALHVRRGL